MEGGEKEGGKGCNVLMEGWDGEQEEGREKREEWKGGGEQERDHADFSARSGHGAVQAPYPAVVQFQSRVEA